MIESAQRYDIKGKAYIETVGVVMVAEKDKAGKVMRKHLEVDFACNLVSTHYDEYGILICFIRLPFPHHRKIADANGPHISTGLGNHEHTDHRHCISPEYHRNIETKTEDDRQPHISKLRVLVFFALL